MKNTLLTELENKFESIESDNRSEEEIEEANATANLDGGAGPPKTPNAFTDDGMNGSHIEVLGYKKTKKSNIHTKKLAEMEKKMADRIEALVNEISYKEYKRDDSKKDYQKINDSIKSINRMMFEVERMVTQNLKLKKESSVSMDKYWKSTQGRFGKISEKMLRISQKIKELNS
jgi:hypothetical protein